jgi:predicted nucleic acid-binding protein
LRFWDSSALVPLIIDEQTSVALRRLLMRDRHIIASWLTAVEITSALWRRRHHNELDATAHQDADASFAQISRRWTAMPAAEVTDRAIDLLSRHALRAADSVQLASALFAVSRFGPLPFVTLDQDLAAAARAEGFTVIP